METSGESKAGRVSLTATKTAIETTRVREIISMETTTSLMMTGT